ncbi:MAG: sigma-54-dependent Fis family transcriptional regulator [Deltaproteobacteria bacterium]|nr:sigma-54-dependent Fis family transcriptional regulator [Deltaproteobacteria bacterium]
MRVLVVDDDETLRLIVRAALEERSYHVEEAEDGVEAVHKVTTAGPFDAVILDVNMPRMSGLDALCKIRELSPTSFCLIMTAYSNIQDAVTAIKHGAYDYLEKPVDSDRLLKVMDAAMAANALVEQLRFSAPQLEFDKGRKIIGSSTQIQKVFEIIHRLAKVETSVLVRGESGTGKELVARAIHFNSQRMKGPFVAVNCAAIPENLIESELFGHEKGAFTGADRRKIGKFQFAEGGTIFLDEIGDISQQMQVKLLRVLQERMFTPVGSNQDIKADIRVVAATNAPLEKMIETGAFRADLFYRLNVMPIRLPSLRDRREDIAPLGGFMIQKFNKLHGRSIRGFDPKALASMRLYQWPGNIRELENVVEHAFIIENSDVIRLDALPDHLQDLVKTRPDGAVSAAPEVDFNEGNHGGSQLNYPQLKERFEREFIVRALKAFNGKINQTAEHTQMTKVTLLRKLEKYGIDPKQFA